MENCIKRVRVKHIQLALQPNKVLKEITKENISTQLVTHPLRKFERAVNYHILKVIIDINKLINKLINEWMPERGYQ